MLSKQFPEHFGFEYNASIWDCQLQTERKLQRKFCSRIPPKMPGTTIVSLMAAVMGSEVPLSQMGFGPFSTFSLFTTLALFANVHGKPADPDGRYACPRRPALTLSHSR
jgi:hypothetical protein